MTKTRIEISPLCSCLSFSLSLFLAAEWNVSVKSLPRLCRHAARKGRQTLSVPRRESGGGKEDELNKPSDSLLGSARRWPTSVTWGSRVKRCCIFGGRTAHSAASGGLRWAEGGLRHGVGGAKPIPCTTMLEVYGNKVLELAGHASEWACSARTAEPRAGSSRRVHCRSLAVWAAVMFKVYTHCGCTATRAGGMEEFKQNPGDKYLSRWSYQTGFDREIIVKYLVFRIPPSELNVLYPLHFPSRANSL